MLNAFHLQGNTVLVAASSSTSVAATRVSTGNHQAAIITNPSTVTIYIAFGSSAVAAAQPTTGVPAGGHPIPAGTTKPFTISPSSAYCWISAVTSAGAAAPGLFATPGFGL